jgi:hypothetical protein
MSSGITTHTAEYRQWLGELKTRFRQVQLKAAVTVNTAMLQFYWELGADVVEKQKAYAWGQGFVGQLSADLMREFPDVKGFSVRNLKNARQWYKFWLPMPIGQQAVAQLRNSLFRQFCPFPGATTWPSWPSASSTTKRCKASCPASRRLSRRGSSEAHPRIMRTASAQSAQLLPTGSSHYQQHQMTEGDQHSIGILLCTQKNHEMVQFALAGMANNLFVSRYQLELPATDAMEDFLRRAMAELGGGDLGEAGRVGV